MSQWDRLIYLILLSFLLPYIAEIRPTDFAQFNVKTQGIFAQPIAALSLVAELPSRSNLARLRRGSGCSSSSALNCLPHIPALRHTPPSACAISELSFVRVLAAFLPQQQASDLFRMPGC
jgi:hypothetical protein